MIIYKKNSDELVIPVGLGPNVSPITGYELQMKRVDSSTELQHVEPDSSYYGLYRVIVDPYELDSKTVDASTEAQVITSSKDGLFQVIVNPYTLESKNETVTENGTFTYSPSTANGLAQVTVDVSVDTVNNQSKTVDSSTTMQYVQPDEGYTGLDYVAVNPYTLESKSETITASGQYTYTATDADALSEVTVDVSINDSPELQSKTVDSSTVQQTVQADSGYDGLSQVVVEPYTLDSKTVNPSTNQQIITSDADGLSQVTVNAMNLQRVNYVDPSYIWGSRRWVFTPSTGYDGLEQVLVGKPKVSDFVGNSSTNQQVITPSDWYCDLFGKVTIWPYTTETDSSTLTQNGTYTFTPTNADALSQVTIDVSVAGQSVNNQNKTVDSSTVSQSVTADNGYTGLGTVTVNPYMLDSKTVDSSTRSQTVTSDEDGLSSVTVNPYVLSNADITPSYATTWSVEGQRSSRTYSRSEIAVNPSCNGLRDVTVYSPIWRTAYVNPSTNQQIIWPSDVSAQQGPCEYIGKVQVNAVTAAIDPDIQAGNIKQGVEILGVTGTYTGQQINNQNKTVDSSTVSQSVTADNGYTGLGTVTVNPYTTETDSSTLTQNGTYTFTPTNADTLSQVTVNVSVNSSSNTEWVIQARKGITTDASNVSLTANRQLCYSYLCYGASGLVGLPLIADTTLPYLQSYYYAFFSCPVSGNVTIPNLTQITGKSALSCAFQATHITGVNFPALQDVSASNALYGTFCICKSLTDASFPDLISIKGYEAAMDMFGGDSSLANISFPSLEEINGEEAAALMFDACYSLTSVSFPSLETIYGLNAAQNMFTGCRSLTSASFPELQFVGEPNEEYVCDGMFSGCSTYETLYVPKLEATESNRMCIDGICGGYDNIRTLTCKPSFATSQRSRLQGLENLTLTGSITTNFDLQYSDDLTPQSVLNVLQAIDTTQQTPGTVTFYHEGLMVNDFQDGRIRTAYNTAVAAGWTIQNLLFIDPSQYTRVDYIESTGQTLNLGNTLGRYDAVYADYEMTAGDGGIFIGTDGTGAYRFGFGSDGQGNLYEHYGTNGEDVFTGAAAGFNTRYQGCMGIYTDDVGGWTWSDFSYGETYPAYNVDDYDGSGSNVLRFANASNYGKIRSIKVYTNLTWAININFDIHYNIMFYDSPIYAYIPLKRLSDNAYGLYEMNTGVFYTAQGITGGMDNNS